MVTLIILSKVFMSLPDLSSMTVNIMVSKSRASKIIILGRPLLKKSYSKNATAIAVRKIVLFDIFNLFASI